MKKLISLLTLGLSLAASFAGPTRFTGSFLANSYTWLYVTNNFSLTNQNINLGTGSTNIYCLNVQSWTNVLTGGTNGLGNTIPGWGVKQVDFLPDALGNISTNLILAIAMNDTNAQSLQPYQTLPLSWYNTNGAFIYGSATNLFTNSFGVVTTNITWYAPVPVGPITSTTNTNTVTLTFGKHLFGPYYGTAAADIMTVTILETGNPQQVYITNMPTTFMQGSDGMQLQKIVTSNVTNSTGVLFNDIRLIGWSP